jgi:hypothetical protein
MNEEDRKPRGSDEPCGTCGGDGRIANSFGLSATCPSCHGNGRRFVDVGFHDVTKTKPSHHRPARTAGAVAKAQWPVTPEGGRLAAEVRDSTTCTDAAKARLIQEIIEYEDSHGQCTQTFIKKLRKQFRTKA